MKLASRNAARTALAFFLLFFSITAHAQILKPVEWSYSVNKVSDCEADLVFQAKIDAGWHLYSQIIPEGGPIPTSFTLAPSAAYEKAG